MNNNLISKTLKSYILYKKYKNFCCQMYKHISRCPIEDNIKVHKYNKLLKLSNDIDIIYNFPLVLHQLSYTWIEYRWGIIVKDCGYLDIDNTLKYIILPNNFRLDYNLNNQEQQKFILKDDFRKYIHKTIKPIHCQIQIKKNNFTGVKIYSAKPSIPTIDGKLYGLCVEFMDKENSLIIFGIVDSDSLRYYRNNIDKNIIYNDIYEKYKIDRNKAKPYLDSYSYRDYLIYETRQITNKIKQKIEKMEYYQKVEAQVLLDEFSFLPYENKIELMTILLEVNMKDKIDYITSKVPIRHRFFDLVLRSKMNQVEPIVFSINNNKTNNTIEDQINGLNTTDKNKSKAFDKLKIVNMSNDGAPKAQKYLDGILKIPFGKIRIEDGLKNPEKNLIEEFKKLYPGIDINNPYLVFKNIKNNKEVEKDKSDLAVKNLKILDESRDKQQEYLNEVQNILEKSVHGHNLVKIQFKRLLAQWITGGQSGIVIGIEGPPGVGKTSLIKDGLANCLIDKDNKPRPVGFIPLGGSSNASSLVGHGYTYQGSTWGRIVDILMDCECMNPIFLFDELDKVSRTESGREVISILTHLTDSSQNDEFHDKYFEGVSFDLSKALMVFTFNDRSEIDPILLDRMTIIETKALSLKDKKIVARKHLIPQICKVLAIDTKDVILNDMELDDLIHDYTREAGVRQLKKLLESLLQELNLRRLVNPSVEIRIDTPLIREVLNHRDKIRKESISEENSLVGQINGMYANVLGLGGILPIQVSKNSDDKKLELTGMQGDVMKESMICAQTMAITLLKKNFPNHNYCDKPNGLHIHVPSASTPKDGPSAGGAICLAIYSYLSKQKIYTNVAMTGEIDLRGNIKAIGGLEAKLNGARKAKINKALIPKENKEQLERIRKEKKVIEDDNFEIIMIENIEEAIRHIIQN